MRGAETFRSHAQNLELGPAYWFSPQWPLRFCMEEAFWTQRKLGGYTTVFDAAHPPPRKR